MAQIAALPLTNSELSVVIALPHDGVALASYEATLSANSSALAIPSGDQLVEISLPKVNFTTDSMSLSKALSTLGMTTAFDPTSAPSRVKATLWLAPVTSGRKCFATSPSSWKGALSPS